MFVPIKEVLDEYRADLMRFKDDPRVGDFRYYKKDGCLVIEGEGMGYYIEMSRVKTPEEAFNWLCHLHQKRWFSPQMHNDFIEIITLITDLNEYCSNCFCSEM